MRNSKYYFAFNSEVNNGKAWAVRFVLLYFGFIKEGMFEKVMYSYSASIVIYYFPSPVE